MIFKIFNFQKGDEQTTAIVYNNLKEIWMYEGKLSNLIPELFLMMKEMKDKIQQNETNSNSVRKDMLDEKLMLNSKDFFLENF